MTDGLEAYNGLVPPIPGDWPAPVESAPLLTVVCHGGSGWFCRGPASSITITCPTIRATAHASASRTNADFLKSTTTPSPRTGVLEGAAANLTLSTNGDARVWFLRGYGQLGRKERSTARDSPPTAFSRLLRWSVFRHVGRLLVSGVRRRAARRYALKARKRQEAFVRQYWAAGPNAL